MLQFILLFFLTTTVVWGSLPPSVAVNEPELDRGRDGIAFKAGTDERFSGTYTSTVYWGNRRTLEPEGIRSKTVSEFVEGVKSGVERVWVYSPDGKVARETTFSRGVRNGVEKVYGWGAGRRMYGAARYEVSYANGLKDGESIGFDNEGRVIWHVRFYAGIPEPFDLDSTVTYHSVVTRDEVIYRRNEPDVPFTGFMVSFNPDGLLHYKRTYANGVPDGTWMRFFYGNGQLDMMSEWRDGKQHGYALSWWTPGIIKSRAMFDEGRMISSFEYDRSGNLRDSRLPDDTGSNEP